MAMDRGWTRTVWALLALVLSPALSRADVDVEITSGDRVTSSLRAPAETEVYRLSIPAGATVTVVAKGKRAAGLDAASGVVVRLLDEQGGEIAGGAGTTSRPAVRFKGVRIDTSADYLLSVRAAEPGAYQLRVKWKSPTRFPVHGVAGPGGLDVPFAADAGATAVLRVSGGRRGSVRVDHLSSEDGSFNRQFAPPPGRSHVVRDVDLPVPGNYSLTVTDTAASGAEVRGTIRVRPPAASRQKIDLTLAGPGGGAVEWVVGRVIDLDGGAIEIEPDHPSHLGPARLTVNSGVTTRRKTVWLANSTPIDPGVLVIAAGPTVAVDAPGAFPESGVRLTIPFDPSLLTPALDGLHVVRRTSDGRRLVVPGSALTVDPEAGLVSFEVPGQGSFRVVGTPLVPPAVAGDLDRDGFEELLVRAPVADGTDGRLYVYRGGPALGGGSTADADLTLFGPVSGGLFGASSVVADLDGDGTDDLAVGVPGSFDGGEVHVFLGGPDFFTRAVGGADRVLRGTGEDFFGISLGTADLDGDGKADLAVGAESSFGLGTFGAGAVFVFHGGSGFPNRTTAQADVVFSGKSDGDYFGVSVVLTDVTGDGRADVIVGADQADGDPDVQGRVYVFRGEDDMPDRFASQADVELRGEDEFDGFGLTIAAGDVTGDGVADLLIGAPYHSPLPNRFESGAAYLFTGGANLTGGAAAQQATAKIRGAAEEDLLGTGVGVGDVDGDGVGDVIVGADGAQDAGESYPGAVYVFLGATNIGSTTAASANLTFFGEVDFDGLARVESPHDVTGDGLPDLIVAAPYNEGGGQLSGALYVVNGGPGITAGGILQAAATVIVGQPNEFVGTNRDL